MKQLSFKTALLIFTLLAVAPSLSAQAQTAYGLNDVSVLIPLPALNLNFKLLAPMNAGPKGVLMPGDVYQRFPPIDSQSDAVLMYQKSLKVIGIRIDPCFTEGTSTVCRRQIRLVWQPVVYLTNDRVETMDSAMHSFYEFSETEWAQVIKAWAPFVRGNLKEGLTIHPALAQEGLSGPTWTAMRAFILQFCGKQNLVRLTAMRLTADRMWTFFGLDKVGTAFNFMNIPNVPSNRAQAFLLSQAGMLNHEEFDGQLAPEIVGGELLQTFVSSSERFKSSRPESDAKKLLTKMVQFENPNLSNTGTVDCASCHVAQIVKLWGKRNYQQWDWNKEFSNSEFRSSMNLENNSVQPDQNNRVRSFGYFQADPIFSQRVINESSLVALKLSKLR